MQSAKRLLLQFFFVQKAFTFFFIQVMSTVHHFAAGCSPMLGAPTFALCALRVARPIIRRFFYCWASSVNSLMSMSPQKHAVLCCAEKKTWTTWSSILRSWDCVRLVFVHLIYLQQWVFVKINWQERFWGHPTNHKNTLLIKVNTIIKISNYIFDLNIYRRNRINYEKYIGIQKN